MLYPISMLKPLACIFDSSRPPLERQSHRLLHVSPPFLREGGEKVRVDRRGGRERFTTTFSFASMF